MARGFASNYRIVLLSVVVVAAFVGIGLRLVDLHVIDRERLTRYVDKARRQVVVEKARHEDILDARGQILTTSRPLIVMENVEEGGFFGRMWDFVMMKFHQWFGSWFS